MSSPLRADEAAASMPDDKGRFGAFGGRYVPETLVPALDRLQAGIERYLHQPEFQAEFSRELKSWVGRPTALSPAPTLSKRWGAQVWLKREDLAHTGAHKINNAIGQTLLAKRLGAKRIIAETGAGQHGVASAAAAARLGMPCVVYMGAVDVERQAPNVDRMKLLGATVVPVTGGDKTLRAAIDEALRDWVSDPDGTYYSMGSAVGPHPYPYLVRELQSVIGREARAQMLEAAGRLPDVAVACVGGGSNAIGLFHPFLERSCGATARRGGRRTRPRLGRQRRIADFRHARSVAGQLFADSAGCLRPGARNAFGVGRLGLFGSGSRACVPQEKRPGDLRVGDRFRGAGRACGVREIRRHFAGHRKRARLFRCAALRR